MASNTLNTTPVRQAAVSTAAAALESVNTQSPVNVNYGLSSIVTPQSEKETEADDEIMSDATDDEEEETEEEAIEREIEELVSAAKDACRFIEDDDRNGQIQCMCVSGDTCGTGQQIWRKVISDFFGRNKKSAQQIPEIYQVIWCRKHYQRGAYQKGKPAAAATSGKQSSLSKITWIVVQLLLIEKWRPGCKYTISFSERERKRIKAANGGRITQTKGPRGRGKTGRTNVKTERDAPVDVVMGYEQHLGEDKNTQDCLRVVNEMKYDVEEDRTIYLPGIEFLPEVDDDFELPPRAKKTGTPPDRHDSAGEQDDRDDQDDEQTGEDSNDDNGGGGSFFTTMMGTQMSSQAFNGLKMETHSANSIPASHSSAPSPPDNQIGHANSARDCPMPSAGFTAINRPKDEYHGCKDSDYELEYDPDDYPPDDPRNHIRKQVMQMREEILAREASEESKTPMDNSTPSTPSSPCPPRRKPETPVSISPIDDIRAVDDLLRLQRFSQPINPYPFIPGNLQSASLKTCSTQVAQKHPYQKLDALSGVENDAVNSLLSLKNSAADFRPHSVHSFSEDRVPSGVLHSTRRISDPTDGSRKRRRVSDEDEDVEMDRRGRSPTDRPIKRIRAVSGERSLYWE
ncbi:hypothetical protein EV356DRAFT_338980 [Viridothelium virens]|uniref:Uncharacterized protein n=1 Tax=Viridothelium virens TaxID=1048519 RepID=A0A6A6HK16_VIRVR|nr:hypothetical protein EV356DRAFT_338980 [Viridothelium virens]